MDAAAFSEGDIVEIVDMAYAVDHNFPAYAGRLGVVRDAAGKWGRHLAADGTWHPYLSVTFDNSGAEDADEQLVKLGFSVDMMRRPTNLLVPAFAIALRTPARVAA
jgi:hypothetical protein